MNLIELPSLYEMHSVLFIQPHPDDNEIGAGGTMALLRKHGIDVYGLTVTKGEGGTSDSSLTPKEIATIREEEADQAMACLDVKNLGTLGYQELSMVNHELLVKQLVLIMRDLQVDAVFTVDPELKNELHPTHIQVAHAVCEAFNRCGVIHYPYDHQRHQKVYTPKILGFYFTGNANVIVNISEVMNLKLEAVQKHKSQMNELLLSSIDQMAQTNALGYSFSYAEPLRILSPMQTHAFAVPESMLKLLPAMIIE